MFDRFKGMFSSSQPPEPNPGGNGKYVNPFTILEAEKKYIKKNEDFYLKQQTLRRPVEIKWNKKFLAYIGEHYTEFDSKHNRFFNTQNNPLIDPYSGKEKKNKVRIVVNFPSTDTQSLLGKLSTGELIWNFRSLSQDNDRREEADTAKAYLEWFWREGGPVPYDAIVEEARLWSLICGLGWLHPTWNPNRGELLSYEEQIDITDPQNLESYSDALPTKYRYSGDIDLVALSPFNVLMEPGRAVHESRCIMKLSVMPVEEIDNLYGVKVSPEDPRNVDIYNVEFTGAELKTRQDMFGGTFDSMGSNLYEGCAVIKELWENPLDPNARLIRTAGGKLLLTKEESEPILFPTWLYGNKMRKLPFIPLTNIKSPNGPIGSRSQIDDSLPLTKAYERSYNQIMEIQNLYCRPIFIYPSTSGIPKDFVTNDPNQQLPYNPGFGNAKPEMLQPPNMPSYIHTNMDRLHLDKSEMAANDTSSITKVQTLGQAMQIEERDRSRLSPIVDSWHWSYVEIGRFLTEMIHNTVQEERVIPIVGKMSEMEETPVNPSQWMMNFIIEVDKNALTPRSRTAQSFRALEATRYGLLDLLNPVEKEMALRAFFGGDIDAVLHNQKADEELANGENKLF